MLFRRNCVGLPGYEHSGEPFGAELLFLMLHVSFLGFF